MRFLQFVAIGLCSVGFAGCSLKPVNHHSPQQLAIEIVAPLPDSVHETSGLAYAGNYLWTMNDSGNAPALFAFRRDGRAFVKKVLLANAENTDWESLAANSTHLFVADCGNNYNTRQTFSLYAVSIASLVAATNGGHAASKRIRFRYSDLTDSLPSRNTNHDCEAMTVVDNQLWLFSKDWGDQQTRLYLLDPTMPDQTLDPVMTLPVNGLITAADFNPATGQLALLGYVNPGLFGSSFVWVMQLSGQPDDLRPDWTSAVRYELAPHSQWEAILWESPTSLLLTTEKNPMTPQQLGRISLPIAPSSGQ